MGLKLKIHIFLKSSYSRSSGRYRRSGKLGICMMRTEAMHRCLARVYYFMRTGIEQGDPVIQLPPLLSGLPDSIRGWLQKKIAIAYISLKNSEGRPTIRRSWVTFHRISILFWISDCHNNGFDILFSPCAQHLFNWNSEDHVSWKHSGAQRKCPLLPGSTGEWISGLHWNHAAWQNAPCGTMGCASISTYEMQVSEKRMV